MKVPNWQKHSKKEKKRQLKPQALRQAKARRQALKRRFKMNSPTAPFSVCRVGTGVLVPVGELSTRRAKGPLDRVV